MTLERSYLSKILLFGEYTILHGSMGIAMPFRHFKGSWKYDKNNQTKESLVILKNYLQRKHYEGFLKFLDFDEVEYQFSKGLYFDSDIPSGYGIGSSGALSAAIFDAFFNKPKSLSLDEVIHDLSIIESCFHGKSSGLDPLVSYFNQPILTHSNKTIELLDSTNSELNRKIYLLDTGISRSTKPLVEAYLETRRQSETFLLKMQEVAEYNDILVFSYLHGDTKVFERTIKLLSKAHFNFLSMLIPKKFIKLWKNGLESGVFSMKLNGAGGGGFLMIYVHEEHKFKSLIRNERILKIA